MVRKKKSNYNKIMNLDTVLHGSWLMGSIKTQVQTCTLFLVQVQLQVITSTTTFIQLQVQVPITCKKTFYTFKLVYSIKF